MAPTQVLETRKYKTNALGAVDLLGRLGTLPGFIIAEPGPTPKWLIFKTEIRLNRLSR